MASRIHRFRALRRDTYNFLEHGTTRSLLSRLLVQALALLVVVNVVAMTLQSVPAYAQRYSLMFELIERVSLIIFTIEYIVLVWVSVEQPLVRPRPPWRVRLSYVFGWTGLVDFLSVAPFWLSVFAGVDLRALMALRVIRLLKLTRYSVAMRSLLDALSSERRALVGCLVILFAAMLIAATAMHVVEGHVQPDKLGTIPDAMWWAMVTLGTIGYGDVIPITLAGKLVASVTIIAGVIMIALPVGIIVTAFSEQVHRRDFVITWGMVARVPLFNGLDASNIADIMKMLLSQSVDAGGIITRRGDPAHSMYFIASGEVEIDLPDTCVRLGVGQFFGEVAVLRRARRSGTARAVTRCELLALEANDLDTLMQREPELAARINDTMKKRLSREMVDPSGDIVAEEVATAPGDKAQ